MSALHLFTIHYSLSTVHFFNIHCVLFTFHYSFFAIHYSLFIIRYSLFTIHFPSFTVHIDSLSTPRQEYSPPRHTNHLRVSPRVGRVDGKTLFHSGWSCRALSRSLSRSLPLPLSLSRCLSRSHTPPSVDGQTCCDGQPSCSCKNVWCVRKTEILVKQHPLQGVFVCDHAGRVINKLSFHMLMVNHPVSHADGRPCCVYRGTSFISDSPLLGPYSRTLPRVLWWSKGRGLFLMSEVPLQVMVDHDVSRCFGFQVIVRTPF